MKLITSLTWWSFQLNKRIPWEGLAHNKPAPATQSVLSKGKLCNYDKNLLISQKSYAGFGVRKQVGFMWRIMWKLNVIKNLKAILWWWNNSGPGIERSGFSSGSGWNELCDLGWTNVFWAPRIGQVLRIQRPIKQTLFYRYSQTCRRENYVNTEIKYCAIHTRKQL
jgi:hypothetical protein